MKEIDQIKERIEGIAEVQSALITEFKTEREKIEDQSRRLTQVEANAVDQATAHTLRELVRLLLLRTDKIPKEIPVRHHHHFDLRSKGFVISAVVLLLTTAITVGTACHLWRRNRELQANAVKFRMIRQARLDIAIWADSTYRKNPKEAERTTEALEEKAMANQAAEATAREREKEAKRPVTRPTA